MELLNSFLNDFEFNKIGFKAVIKILFRIVFVVSSAYLITFIGYFKFKIVTLI